MAFKFHSNVPKEEPEKTEKSIPGKETKKVDAPDSKVDKGITFSRTDGQPRKISKFDHISKTDDIERPKGGGCSTDYAVNHVGHEITHFPGDGDCTKDKCGVVEDTYFYQYYGGDYGINRASDGGTCQGFYSTNRSIEGCDSYKVTLDL